MFLQMTEKIIPSSPKSIQFCCVENCTNPILSVSRQLCNTHYLRLQRNGTTDRVKVQAPLTICSVENCGKKARYPRTKPLCSMHTFRLKYKGSLDIEVPTIESQFKKFARITESPNDCWEWQGTITIYGYGQLACNGKVYRAHRASFFIHNGYWAKESVLHSCDNRKCVNPNHLREGTHQENMNDAMLRNRMSKGEKVGTSTLTEPQVIEIKKRIAKGETDINIAKDYGVSRCAIYSIKTNTNWKHVKI